MRLLLVIVFSFWCFNANAGTLYLHTLSTHIPQNNHNLLEFDPGLAYETNDGYRIGFYRNAYNRISWYGLIKFKLTKTIDFGLGAITGYQIRNWGISQKDSGLIPFPVLEWKLPWIPSASLFIGPGVINLEWRFGL